MSSCPSLSSNAGMSPFDATSVANTSSVCPCLISSKAFFVRRTGMGQVRPLASTVLSAVVIIIPPLRRRRAALLRSISFFYYTIKKKVAKNMIKIIQKPSRCDLFPEPVSGPRNSEYVFRLGGVFFYLLSQVLDMDIDDPAP